jgi:hypothetical protein
MKITKASKIKYQRDLAFDNFEKILDAINSANVPEFGDIVAVLSKRGKLFELNITSAIFWESIDVCSSLDGLSNIIADCFEVEKSQIYDDMLHLTQELSKWGLINIEN